MSNFNPIVAKIKASGDKLILDANNVEISNNLLVHGNIIRGPSANASIYVITKDDSTELHINNNLITQAAIDTSGLHLIILNNDF